MKTQTYIFLFFILLMIQKVGYAEDQTNTPIYQNGILNIPSVSVSDGAGCFENYNAELTLIPSSNPLSFRLIEAQQISSSSSCNINVNTASYQNGILTLPIVDVADGSGNLTTFEADLALTPSSNSMIFELLRAQLYTPPAENPTTIEDLSFDDPNLNTCIQNEIADNDWKYVDEVNILSCPNSNISNLGGIEKLVNLFSLDLAFNQISDIMPLANLTSLKYFTIGNNQISDITPLANLTSLITLTLGVNPISDIRPLENLTGLTYININDSQVSDITPLSNLTSLTNLYLDYNQISDITSLTNNTFAKNH